MSLSDNLFADLRAELSAPRPAAVKKGKRPIYAADSETDPFKRGRVPKPFIWGVVDTGTIGTANEDYNEFTDTAEFIEYMSEIECICYIHNGGKFDYHFITKFIADWQPLTIINGRLAKFRIGLCEFRDSFNIIPAPLASFQKDEIDYAIFEESERHKPENWKKISDYLRSDCIYLGLMVRQFIDDYGLHLTQATAAMKNWEKIAEIKKPKTSQSYYEEMQAFYYGGRVQCFERGIIERPFKVIDIKSAYPFAMVHLHPWGQAFGFSDTIEGWSDDRISRAFIELQAESRGAFPMRTKDSGLQFPADGETRTFTISGWEYLAARDTGTLGEHKIESVRYYYETISFTEYVEHFFAIKNDADEWIAKLSEGHPDYYTWVATRMFAKIFLNALYGKFASNPENYAEFMTIPASKLAGAHNFDDWDFCKLISQETAVVTRPLPEEKHRFYDVAVSASITGFVRAYLWRAIQQCSDVLYCDTDSIACGDTGSLQLGKKLGDWDCEAVCDMGAIAGKKLYAFRRAPGSYNPNKEKPFKIASKGVRLTAAEIIEIASGKAQIYVPEVPTFSIRREPIFTPRTIRERAK
jgi:hypothetical protein